MALIKFPDLTLKLILDLLLKQIKDNYTNSIEQSESFLYRLYGGLKIGNFGIYESAVKIFNWNNNDPRKIDTRIMYDKRRANIPTIHVTIPEEVPHGDGIGMDEGYQESTANTGNTTLTTYLTRSYNMKFQLYITSDNEYEVVIIYNTLKAIMINNIPLLEANGYSNAKIYGQDVKINEQTTPIVFMRNLFLECNYELNVPSLEITSVVNGIKLNGKAYVD